MSEYEDRDELTELSEVSADPKPIEQFGRWFADAVAAGLKLPNAMTLATATPDAVPSPRVVLLKDFDEQGFVFYTNYDSQKGCKLEANPRAALSFYWPALDRQVLISGRVTTTTREENKTHF